MREYRDLIFYKQDIIDEYAAKRGKLNKEEVEDLLRCSLLYLEDFAKNNNSPILIPNIGYIHKKVDLEKITRDIKEEDNRLVESAYLSTSFSPIITRKTLVEQYYKEYTLKELQEIQNNK